MKKKTDMTVARVAPYLLAALVERAGGRVEIAPEEMEALVATGGYLDISHETGDGKWVLVSVRPKVN